MKKRNDYWWNKDEKTRAKNMFIGKYWFICNHNIHVRAELCVHRCPIENAASNITNIFIRTLKEYFNALPFVFSLVLACFLIRLRHCSPFMRLLFTDLRTQWFFSIENLSDDVAKQLIKYCNDKKVIAIQFFQCNRISSQQQRVHNSQESFFYYCSSLLAIDFSLIFFYESIFLSTISLID